MISVIVTTHAQRGHLCRRAVESVLKQTYQDFEIVVVDDASTDNTTELIKGITDRRIKYFRTKRSRKLQSVVKNKGIRESKGEYLAFLDSDNTYRPDHLMLLANNIHNYPSLDVVYGDRMIHYRNQSSVGYFKDYALENFYERNFIDTSDALVKREAVYYIGGWDERYKRYADWNLFFRLGKAGFNFKRIPQVITDYYIRDDSISFTAENKENPMYPVWNPYDLEIRLPYLGAIPEVKVAAFSITYDRLDYTKKAFHSLNHTAGYTFDHYVVDNGSTDGTVEWLKENFDPSRLILNPDNKGISIASNQVVDLIKKGDYDCILKFDNDCMCLTSGWLEKMVEIYKTNHLFALSCYVQGLRDNPGGSPRAGYGRIKNELIGVTAHLGGICNFVSSKAYDNFRWPEDEQLHGLQDLEFSQHLFKCGYQMGYLENYFVNHGPAGTEGQEKDYPEYFAKRREEKITRYGE